MRMRGPLLAAAMMVGIALGWGVARQHFRRHQRDLFSASPLRRFAALGFLEDAATPDAIPLLRDYVAWEPHGVLRRRAVGLMRRLEATVG